MLFTNTIITPKTTALTADNESCAVDKDPSNEVGLSIDELFRQRKVPSVLQITALKKQSYPGSAMTTGFCGKYSGAQVLLSQSTIPSGRWLRQWACGEVMSTTKLLSACPTLCIGDLGQGYLLGGSHLEIMFSWSLLSMQHGVITVGWNMTNRGNGAGCFISSEKELSGLTRRHVAFG